MRPTVYPRHTIFNRLKPWSPSYLLAVHVTVWDGNVAPMYIIGHPHLFIVRLPLIPSFCAAEKAVQQLRVAVQKDAIVQPLELDVADPDSISAAVQRLREQRTQKIGVLVNNAGMCIRCASLRL